MTGLKEYYNDVLNEDWFGTITGTSSDLPFPSGTARLARFKADTTNQGNIFFGNKDTVFFPLDAGQDTGWFAPSQGRLENYQYVGNGEVLHFWVQR